MTAATRIGSVPWTSGQYECTCEPDASWRTPAQPARRPSQAPPSGPAGETLRDQYPSACRNVQGSPRWTQSRSGYAAKTSGATASWARFLRGRAERHAKIASAGSSATATGRVSRASPHASPAPRKRRAFCGQERDDREHEVERLAVDGLEEERHREQREVEHGPTCAVGSDLVLGEAVEEHERRQARRQRDDDPGEHVVAEQDTSEQADGRRVEREEGRGRAGEVLVAVLGDPEEPDAVPARPDVGHGTEVVRDGGIVPAGCVGVSARLEGEQREERRQPRSPGGSR